MKNISKAFACLLLTALLSFCHSLQAQPPVLYLVSGKTAEKAKRNATPENIAKLKKQADKLVAKQFGSVMDKKFTPPCDNMHEYMSMARYYWPDPTKPDGKPYIKKDGQKNPANDLITDDKNFDDLVDAVHDLSWAYYFTGEEKYAAKSAGLLRFWFIDTATFMMPNLNHSQIRSGIDTGVSTGIIDTHNLPQVLDAIALLRPSKSWTKADEAGMKNWFTQYLQWLTTSTNGKKESQAKNNHGTFYDAQAVAIALFCGEKDLANKILQNDYNRLAWQIEPDGKQPLELERTLALGYSTFNLDAWTRLATTAETEGIDFWHYETKDGRSIKKAIDFLIPYAAENKKWDYQQIGAYKTQDFYRLLLVAADKFKDDTYRQQAEKIKESNKDVLVSLLYN
jgi:hypothetical protein